MLPVLIGVIASRLLDNGTGPVGPGDDWDFTGAAYSPPASPAIFDFTGDTYTPPVSS